MNYVLFDLDNCIADDEWRIKFIDWTQTDANARYRPYHQRCYGDDFCNADTYHAALRDGAQPIFTTARPEEARAITTAWICTRHLKLRTPPIIYMRSENDFIPSVQLKRRMLMTIRALATHADKIVGAYDDREDIVAMYRAEGIDAHVLKIHDTCAYTNPTTKEVPYGK